MIQTPLHENRFIDKFVRYTREMMGRMVQPDVFLPTAALAFLDRIAECFPRHQLLVADFDKLLTTIMAENAPVVNYKEDGQSKALNRY